MLAQSTLISYHTEAFVKTEVACTVRTQQSESFVKGKKSKNTATFALISMLFHCMITNSREAAVRGKYCRLEKRDQQTKS